MRTTREEKERMAKSLSQPGRPIHVIAKNVFRKDAHVETISPKRSLLERSKRTVQASAKRYNRAMRK